MPAELQDDDLDGESDDLPSDLDDEDEGESDEEDHPASHREEDDEEEGSEVLSLAEASDAEDLLSLDADVPDGLIEFDGSEAESEVDEEWGGISETTNKKRKRGDDEKSKRKKLRSLPTFASYDDFAKLIEDGPEDNL